MQDARFKTKGVTVVGGNPRNSGISNPHPKLGGKQTYV